MNKTKIIFIDLLITTISSCSSLLGVKTKTDKPQPDITTKTIRYTYNRPIDLTKFEIEIIDDQLNLFKNNALIKIELEGSFKKKESENAYFDEIVFLEQVNKGDSLGSNFNCEIVVDLLPKFNSKRKKNDKTVYDIQTETVTFKTNLEYRIYTCGFGKNTININVENRREKIEMIKKK